MQPTFQPIRPRVAIRLTRWHDVCRRAGLSTDVDRAKALGVSRTTIYRLQNQITPPSLDIIARACVVFRQPLESLFEVIA